MKRFQCTAEVAPRTAAGLEPDGVGRREPRRSYWGDLYGAIASVMWAVVGLGCEGPIAGTAGAGSVDEAAAGETTPEVAAETAAPREPCDDAGLWRFPGRPEHVVVASDGDAIVAGTSDAGPRVVRYDSEHCDVVWDVVPSVVVRDMALVGDEVVLVGAGLERLAADSGTRRAIDPIAGSEVAGDAGVVWVANGDIVRVVHGAATVVRRDVVVGALVARGDAVYAAIGAEVWRFAGVEAERLATFADEVVGLVLEDGGDILALSGGAALRVERVGVDPWSFELGVGLTGWAARAGADFVVAGSATRASREDDDFARVGDDDGYIARFAPHMAVMWTLEVIGGDGAQTVTGVGGDATGRHWVIGWAEREVVIGEDVLEGGGGFVARRPLGPGW